MLLKSRKASATKTSKPQKEIQHTAKSTTSSKPLNETPSYTKERTSSTGPLVVSTIELTKTDFTTATISNEKCKGKINTYKAMMSTYEDISRYQGLYT